MAWVSNGCGLTSMKVLLRSPAAATAWLNRTGLRRLAAQCWASKTGAGPALSTVLMIGIRGAFGASPANSTCNSGRIGSMVGWWEATSTSTRRARRSCAATSATNSSISPGGPAITV